LERGKENFATDKLSSSHLACTRERVGEREKNIKILWIKPAIILKIRKRWRDIYWNNLRLSLKLR
jgi:hypothetical protein